jgi:peroxisomal 3,2-trans-enoyl-CoA isomerase
VQPAPQALRLGKQIIREKQIPALDAANAAECALIKTRWLSDECMSAVMSFMSKGAK